MLETNHELDHLPPPSPIDDGAPSSPDSPVIPAFQMTASDVHLTRIESPAKVDDNHEAVSIYPGRLALSFILVALLMAMFLVALDMTIVATAIPRITKEFDSLDQIGWYGSAFFLTLAAFQSWWGKAYKYFPLKITFFISIFLFEMGSLASGVAKNSTTLIVGRAITGVGGAGITGGVYTIIAYIVPPPKVPQYIGLVGAVFSFASVAGPLMGGVFTDQLSWRWCFYINLPIGGAALAILFFTFHNPASAKPAPATWKEILLQMDFPGLVTLLASIICFVLALQWGGVTKAWGSADVVGTLVGWIVLLLVFVVIQYVQGERALLVGRMLKSRNILACCVFIFFLNAANFLVTYYLPIYFQAIDGVSPTDSGIRNLPLILSISLFAILSGGLVGKVGYFQPFLVIGAIFATVGAGLLYTLGIGSSAGQYIGYQVLVGIGVGTSIQIPVIAAQALSDMAEIPVVTAVVLFFQLVSGALSVSVAQSLFTNRLIAALPSHAHSVNVQQVLVTGATDIRNTFRPDEVEGILNSYLIGLRAAWAMGIGLAGMAFLASFLPEFKSIKGKVGKGAGAA
ncbi:hypothetical protein MMC07_008721 [Pseudocyphellaria aurata]|nr:hypothetical protein [Pseudocyphellaria aurata]